MTSAERKCEFDELSTRNAGMEFGYWTATGNNNRGKWEVRCVCGTTRFVSRRSLIRRATSSCGCKKGIKRCSDIAGQRFGTLIAKRLSSRYKHGRIAWECECDCGRQIVATGHALRRGNTRSCGAVAHRADYSLVESRIVLQQKRCGKCQRVLPFSSFTRCRRNHDGMYGYCKECHAEANRCRVIANRAHYMWLAKRRDCHRRDLPFDLTEEFIQAGIDRGCAVTGLPFNLSPVKTGMSPSLDRRVAGGGYTMDNVQVVILAYNFAKGEWGHDDVLVMARALLRS